MKLLVEDVDLDLARVVCEGSGDAKQYYIEGIFMQAEVVNGNKRKYPKKVLSEATQEYIDKFVKTNRAIGELGHPDTPTINYDRASHLVKELKEDGNNIMGKAKLIDTPPGRIAKTLVDEGVSLGVSSRSLGAMKEENGFKEVQKAKICAIDIVSDPSAPDAFTSSIMENREWVYCNGKLECRTLDEYKQEIKKASRRHLQETKIRLFEDFLRRLQN